MKIIIIAQTIKSRINSILKQKELYKPMLDAMRILNSKGIPIYFYERVGYLKEYTYAENARRRIKNKLSFTKMYNHLDKYEAEFKSIFGKKYSREYVDKIGRIPQVVKKGDIYCHEDYQSLYINVINGVRFTTNQPTNYKRTIHIYGRCGVFGYAVEDYETVPSRLQKKIIEKGYADIRVVNHGIWGGEDSYIEHNFLEDISGFDENDIVIFYMRKFKKNLMNEMIKQGMYFCSLTEAWHRMVDPVDCIYDRPGHMSARGYDAIAELIIEDLVVGNINVLDNSHQISEKITPAITPHLNRYLKKYMDVSFQKEIKKYTDDIITKYPCKDDNPKCGAIVMNCNPFTNGHSYLVEYASKQVDRLYIFVVEEDKSFFNFKDRFEMVKAGTKNLTNVIVVPSGQFIISALTFPEYFIKDYVKKKEFDVSGDVEIFCKYISPALNIKIRFAGEEPLDPVTNNYNVTMSRILPKYGIQFEEIKRLEAGDGEVVNATRVRQLLNEKDFETLRQFVPESTYRVLIKKYAR